MFVPGNLKLILCSYGLTQLKTCTTGDGEINCLGHKGDKNA